jgi:hypothetical protein
VRCGKVTREATRETPAQRELRPQKSVPVKNGVCTCAGVATTSTLLILLRLLARRVPVVLERLGPVGVIQIAALVHYQRGGGGSSA